MAPILILATKMVVDVSQTVMPTGVTVHEIELSIRVKSQQAGGGRIS